MRCTLRPRRSTRPQGAVEPRSAAGRLLGTLQIHSRLAIALVALLLALGLAACATPGSGLADRAFLSIAVTESGADRPLVAGTRIRIDFRTGDFGASAGCNSIGGPYQIDGGRFVATELSMTEMGCDQDRSAQDDWLGQLLTSRPAIRLAGDELTIEGTTTTIRLLDRKVADPDVALVGATWTVESILSGDTAASIPEGATATVVFQADGTLTLDTGCNQGGGRFATDGGGMTISELMLTKKACDGPGAALEAAVTGVLRSGPITFRIEASVLTLEAGPNGLQLRAS
jgi:heat shock protein HslJ